MKKIILIIMILACIGSIYFLPKKDCSHPIIKRCIEGEVKKARIHIAGRRYWHMPYFYCKTYIVNKNSCYWREINEKRNNTNIF